MIDVAIVGAGPCGLAAAISARRAGLDAVVFDAECVVSSITHYPTYATFFSTAEKLSLGGLPFVTAGGKPSRRDALAYYRAVVRYFDIPVRQYERVTRIDGSDGSFVLRTNRRGMEHATDHDHHARFTARLPTVVDAFATTLETADRDAPVPTCPGWTVLDLVATFDNSVANPRNPNQPPRLVHWGEKTTDEMCLVFLGVTLPDNPKLDLGDLLARRLGR